MLGLCLVSVRSLYRTLFLQNALGTLDSASRFRGRYEQGVAAWCLLGGTGLETRFTALLNNVLRAESIFSDRARYSFGMRFDSRYTFVVGDK